MGRGSQWGERSAEQRGDLGSPASTSGQWAESPGRLESPGNKFSVQPSSYSFRSLLKSQSLRPRLGGEPPSEDDRPHAGALQVTHVSFSLTLFLQSELKVAHPFK